jgi:PIN domain nuclease of toxin-antitoxin system
LSIGKLALSSPFDLLIPQQLSLNGIELLPIKIEHMAAIVSLPFHHRDPFDRLIIAQTKVEKMAVVSIDAIFDNYLIKRLW